MQREISKHLMFPALDAIGIKDFSRRPVLKPVYNRALDNRAMNNPETITEYFNILKGTVEEFKISLRVHTTWMRRNS